MRLAPLRQHSPRSSTVQQNKQAYSTSVIRLPCLRPPYDVLQRRRQTIRCLSIKLSSSAALSLSLHLSHTSVPSTDNSTNAKQINSVAHETRQEHQPPPELFPTIPPTSLCRPLKDYSAKYCVAPFDASHDHTPFATTTLRSRKLSRKQARPTASAQHPKSRFPSFVLPSLPLFASYSSHSQSGDGATTWNAHSLTRQKGSQIRQPAHPCKNSKRSRQPGTSLPDTRFKAKTACRTLTLLASIRKGEPCCSGDSTTTSALHTTFVATCSKFITNDVEGLARTHFWPATVGRGRIFFYGFRLSDHCVWFPFLGSRLDW